MVENVSHKSPMCISGKITTVPRLFSEHLLQDENKHQIMNVHTRCCPSSVVLQADRAVKHLVNMFTLTNDIPLVCDEKGTHQFAQLPQDPQERFDFGGASLCIPLGATGIHQLQMF